MFIFRRNKQILQISWTYSIKTKRFFFVGGGGEGVGGKGMGGDIRPRKDVLTGPSQIMFRKRLEPYKFFEQQYKTWFI